MKTIVSVQEISEFDIKPDEMVAQWRGLVEADIRRRWSDRSHWVRTAWSGCDPGDERHAFDRFSISYAECRSCGSLYAPLRPDENELWAWYREGEATRFWREKMLPESKAARLEKMIRPRADWVLESMAEYVPQAKRLVDISTFGRDLLEIVAAEAPKLQNITAAGMTADVEGDDTGRIKVLPTRAADLPSLGPADVVVAVDAFDRAFDFGALVEACGRLLRTGGVLFATVPVASGFEIQALWDRSPTVIPPDKLNLPSVKSLTRIFSTPGWTILELSTPGMFDADMVRRAVLAAPDDDWPRVVRSLVTDLTPANRTSFVEFLQASRLASFARLAVRKVS